MVIFWKKALCGVSLNCSISAAIGRTDPKKILVYFEILNFCEKNFMSKNATGVAKNFWWLGNVQTSKIREDFSKLLVDHVSFFKT